VASSVSHDQCLPVNLSRSLSRPIDRSYRIDLLFSIFLTLSFSFARSLRFFNRLLQYESFILFYLLTRSFFRAEALYGTTGDLRETRPYFAIVFRFVFCFCASGYSLSHGNRTQHNKTGSFNQRIFQLLCVRFVYSSFDDYRVVSSASTPSTSFTLHSGFAANVDLVFSRLTRLILTVLTTRICSKNKIR